MIAVGDQYLGHAPETLVRVSSPFGGGLGGSHEEACGVLAGAVMVLGALRGRLTPLDNDESLRESVRSLRERFLARFGATQCEAVRSALPDVESRCMPVVREGTRLVVEFMEAQGIPTRA